MKEIVPQSDQESENRKRKNASQDVNGSEQPRNKGPRFFRKLLSEQQKKDIEDKSFDVEKNCPISLELIAEIPSESRFQDIGCGQVFDLVSLIGWITQKDKNTCPHCKKSDVRDLLIVLGHISGEIAQKDSFPETTAETLLGFCKQAIKNKAPIALKRLLMKLKEMDISINLFDLFGNAAIHYAAENGDEVALLLLYDFGAQLNLSRSNGDTPLHIAVKSGNTVAVRFLLLYGANPHAYHDRERTPLVLAAELNLEITKQISLYKEISDIFQIFLSTDNKVISEIINENFNSAEFAKDCLHLACHAESENFLQRFIDDIHRKVNHPQNFIFAPLCVEITKNKYSDIVHFLDILSKNLVIVSADKSLLACKDCSVPTVSESFDTELKAHINQLDNYGQGLIHYAVHYDNPLILAILVNFGADINLRTTKGESPLYIAVQYGHKQVIKLMLACGANIEVDLAQAKQLIKDKLQEFAIELSKYKEVLEIFATTKSTFDNWDKLNEHFWPGGRTRLHLACQRQDRFIAAELLKMGAEVDARDEQGLTPLMLTMANFSSAKTNAWLIYTLQASGANVNARDKCGYTALHYAIRHFNRDAIVQLLQLGADPYSEYKISNKRTIPNAFLFAVSQDIEEVLLFLQAFNEYKYGKSAYILHTAVTVYDTQTKLFGGQHVIEALIFTDREYADSSERYIVSQQDKDEINDEGESPICIAIRQQKVDVIEALIHAGVNLKLEYNGQSVVDLAHVTNNDRVIQVIQDEYDHQLAEDIHYPSDMEDISAAEDEEESFREEVDGHYRSFNC